MSTIATLSRRLAALEAKRDRQKEQSLPILEQLRRDPSQTMSRGGLTPDLWQKTILRTRWNRALLLCSRQSGKSSTAGALAVHTALTRPGSLVLLLSPTQRQSGELFRDKVRRLYYNLGAPVETVQESALTMEFSNQSRIVSLPGDESTVRGYSNVALLICDEASRVPDSLYLAIRPMLAVSRGRLVCLSTPFGRRGFFYESWMSSESWERVCIRASDCPRIDRAFLEEEREALGERWYRQEYECSFEDTCDAVFRQEDIDAAMSDEIEPLYAGA